MKIVHPIEPVYNSKSKILILGSFPSVKSRDEGFFYGHPQNRFWRVISTIFKSKIPTTISEKRELLLKNNVAVWDVIKSCEIVGSSDSTIKNVTANDISIIINSAKIEKIIVNGKTAEKFYNKYILNKINRKAICLPSTSPANATWTFEKLVEAWKIELL
ncbi:MAG: DNA-deoxyinosine glycosylase [Clostridia bacterium]|nr:DNA-deoxyinosine glycosylase [Clostridia bacterium]